MMTCEEIHAVLTAAMPEAEITVEDLTGTQDHFYVIALWQGFRGKSLVEQHQLIHRILKEPIADGRIHALKMKTVTA